MLALVVNTEAPQQPEVLDLLRQSDLLSASLHPVEGRRPLGAEVLCAPGVHFLVARLDGVAVCCCALILHRFRGSSTPLVLPVATVGWPAYTV